MNSKTFKISGLIVVANMALVPSCSQQETERVNQRTQGENSNGGNADAELDAEAMISLTSAGSTAVVGPKTDEAFRADLLAALRASQLSPIEKAQHVMDRLSYGQHSTIMPISALISYDRDGRVDSAATNALIVNYIIESMQPQGYPAPNLEPVVASFPHSDLNYAEISDRVRKLNKWVTDAEFTYSNRNDFIKAVESGAMTVPAQTLRDAIAERDLAGETALRHRTTRVRLKRDLATLEQARFIAHAVARKHSFNTKLLQMWFNRFNVSHDVAGYDLADYLKQINSRVYGNFENLVVATTKHPAMLAYLHNSSNAVRYDRNGVELLPPNEDFARELIELHTLGRVSSAGTSSNTYNLEDIEQAARILSGWNLAGTGTLITDTLPRRFQFIPGNHARGEKTFMRRKFAQGEAGGVELIKFLSGHYFTSMSVARMLVRQFISEAVSVPTAADPEKHEPAPAVVELATAFRESGGNLRRVYQVMLASEHFWSRAAYRSKLKDPLHLVISTLRGAGRSPILNPAEGSNISAGSLTKATMSEAIDQMKLMNQELFNCQLPTGYSDSSMTWGSASTVVSFVNFAFEYSAFLGNGTEQSRKSYFDAEIAARGLRNTPNQMAQSAHNSLLRVYRLHESPLLELMPRDSKAEDAVLSLLEYGRSPDFFINPETRLKSLWPVRSAAGGYFGSAEFMKR
jgi:uncharacterized protein (DUF1800 family)